MGPRIVHQNAAHYLGRQADKVGAILPVNLLTGEPHVGFVDQRRCLQGVVGALTAHIRAGQTMQFSVDQRQQTLGGLRIAGAHCFEQLSHLPGIAFHAPPPADSYGIVCALRDRAG